jgi:hypothetical protein
MNFIDYNCMNKNGQYFLLSECGTPVLSNKNQSKQNRNLLNHHNITIENLIDEMDGSDGALDRDYEPIKQIPLSHDYTSLYII